MFFRGQNTVVGIVTPYRLDGQVFEPRWGRDFLCLSKLALGPTQSPVQRASGLSPGSKVAEAWR
jgi:hypothetical protein